MPAFTPRKKLNHSSPSWVDESTALYFITICCRKRESNQLATPEISSAISDSIRHRVEESLLFPYVLLLMPDHLHMIIGYNTKLTSLQKVIGSFKQRLAQQSGVQ